MHYDDNVTWLCGLINCLIYELESRTKDHSQTRLDKLSGKSLLSILIPVDPYNATSNIPVSTCKDAFDILPATQEQIMQILIRQLSTEAGYTLFA